MTSILISLTLSPTRGVYFAQWLCLVVVMALRDSFTDDDYIAQLLAKEAEEASKKYSELGVRALLPTRSADCASRNPRPSLTKVVVADLRQLPRNQIRDF